MAKRADNSREADERSQLMTVAQVAALFGVSTRTVHRLVERGELEGYRVLGAKRISMAGVRAYLQAHRMGRGRDDRGQHG